MREPRALSYGGQSSECQALPVPVRQRWAITCCKVNDRDTNLMSDTTKELCVIIALSLKQVCVISQLVAR